MKKIRAIILILALMCFSGLFVACNTSDKEIDYKITVSFDTDGGTLVEPLKTQNDSLTVKRPTDPEKKYYDFVDWYSATTDAAPFNFDTVIMADTTLHAVWVKSTSAHCVVSFDTNGGSPIAPITIAKGNVLKDIEEPIKIGGIFTGWFSDSDFTQRLDINTFKIKKDMTIYAQFIQQFYTLTYDYQGGIGLLPNQIVELNDSDYTLVAPIHEKYTFDGWYTKIGGGGKKLTDSEGNASEPWNIKKDVTVYAHWLGTQGLIYTEDYEQKGYMVYDRGEIHESKIVLPKYYRGAPVVKISGAFSGNDDEVAPITEIYIPNTVRIIDSYSFNNCKSLATVDFEEGSQLKTIQSYTFSGCEKLNLIELPKSLESIESSAFSYCTQLTDLTVPDTVINIGSLAFDKTPFYQKLLDESESIIYLGKVAYALSKNSAVTEIVIRNGTVRLSEYLLTSNDNIISVEIPESVVYLPALSIKGSLSIKNIKISPNNKYFASVNNTIYSKDLKNLKLYLTANTDTRFVVPPTVETIERGAITFNRTLRFLTLGENVKAVGEDLLDGCINLVQLTLPDNPPEILESYENEMLQEGGIMVVSESAKEKYIQNEFWGKYAKIIYTESLMEISDKYGNSFYKSGNDLIRFISNGGSYAIVPDGIERICDRAFGAYYLSGLYIPSSVNYISSKAVDNYLPLHFQGHSSSVGGEWISYNICNNCTCPMFK